MRYAFMLGLILSLLVTAPGQAQSSTTIKRNSMVQRANPVPNGFSNGFGFGTTFGGIHQGGYPIGTGTGSSPYFSNGLGPAPGVSSATGMGISPGEFFYYNNPGIGYYSASPLAPQMPAPVTAAPAGAQGFSTLGARAGYWHAPSGYYYPFFPPVYVPGAVLENTVVIYNIDQGAFTPGKPPVRQVLNDLRNFLEDAKSKNQLDQSNYERLTIGVNDIAAQAAQLAQKNDGVLDSSDEALVRKQLDSLITEITRAVNP